MKARDELSEALISLAEIRTKLITLRDAVPGAFDTAKANYLAEIDARAPALEQAFADTLNTGFKGIYLSTMAAALLAGLLLVAYPRRSGTVLVPVPTTASQEH